MNRLDEVLGPENWWDDYSPMENSVICRLTIRLPDGTTLTKSDAGGYAGLADSGDDDKSGFSDAFKRVSVKFGVGRHLYGDGVPSFVIADNVSPGRSNPNPPPDPVQDTPEGITEDEAFDRIADGISVVFREHGSDDIPATPGDSNKDGRWLFLRTQQRGHTAWYQAFGREHGYPKLIVQWSPQMVAMAIDARKKAVLT